MKAKLIFYLPEEEKEFHKACKGDDIASALWDISQYLREVDKYETGHTIEQIRERFREILDSYDINLDNLIE